MLYILVPTMQNSSSPIFKVCKGYISHLGILSILYKFIKDPGTKFKSFKVLTFLNSTNQINLTNSINTKTYSAFKQIL